MPAVLALVPPCRFVPELGRMYPSPLAEELIRPQPTSPDEMRCDALACWLVPLAPSASSLASSALLRHRSLETDSLFSRPMVPIWMSMPIPPKYSFPGLASPASSIHHPLLSMSPATRSLPPPGRLIGQCASRTSPLLLNVHHCPLSPRSRKPTHNCNSVSTARYHGTRDR
ncbi:hypothetical protein B0T17DRAFT_507778 [Bombardia bombarda]|uniref:Uncharacterized protein n=1 Tax=Bombardia bombarda TaxID=252184 RepID=A0AA39WZX4_9PEZI|nr:hypothetical protein B0T17DRAFT_507778 [Bombardia bombarda]